MSVELFMRRLLLLVIFFLPVWPSFVAFKIPPLPAMDLPRCLILVLALMWGVAVLISASLRARLAHIRRKHRLVFLLMLAMFGWKVLSTLVSGGGVHAYFSAFRDIVFFLVIFLIALSVLRRKEYVNTIAYVIVVASLVVSTFAIIEAIQGRNFFADYCTSSEIAENLIEPNIRNGELRVSATFANALALASYICFSLPLIAYVFFHSPRLVWRGLAVLSIVLSIIALYHTHSRGGAAIIAGLGLLLFLGGVLEWIKRMPRELRPPAALLSMALIGILGVLVFVSASDLFQGRTEKEAGSIEIRELQMLRGLPLIAARPWLGYGPGEAAEVLGLWAMTVDNYYLTLALESGLPEVLLFAVILSVFIAMGLKLYRSKWSGRYLSYSILLAIIGNSAFMSVLSLEQVLPMLFLAFAMILILQDERSKMKLVVK